MQRTAQRRRRSVVRPERASRWRYLGCVDQTEDQGLLPVRADDLGEHESREEGYFRREWKLAVDRTNDMAGDRAFLLPIVTDGTSDSEARVPEKFREVQWTRLPAGASTDTFVSHVRRLLSPEAATPAVASARSAVLPASSTVAARARSTLPASRSFLPWIVGGLLIIATGYFVADKFWISKHLAASTAFNPPPHSIAVLPFANMSGDKDQEYFSDGLTEELLNSLSEINELQVAARTSAFSFKGTNTDIGTIARKLNVGAVLEGSVRRSANTIRITAQLINAVTGFHLWSKTYDRDLWDVLKLKSEIATAVASALKITLLGDVAAKVELRGTRNPDAFDAYLRAAKAYSSIHEAKELPAAIAAYAEAIRLDPHYALAFAGRSIVVSTAAGEAETAAAAREGFDKAQAGARQALELAPDLAQAHLASAIVSESGTIDFMQASAAYERALALAPGNAQVLRDSGLFAVNMGHFYAALAAVRRAVVFDPLSRETHGFLGAALYTARRYEEALAAFAEVISLDPAFKETCAQRGLAYYGLGDLQSARVSCETQPDDWGSQQCLAVVYDKLSRHADAEAELSKMKAAGGDSNAYQYATIYAQWATEPRRSNGSVRRFGCVPRAWNQ